MLHGIASTGWCCGPLTAWRAHSGHLLETLARLNCLGIQFISLLENIDTGGPWFQAG
jgi:hypothetical protein